MAVLARSVVESVVVCGSECSGCFRASRRFLFECLVGLSPPILHPVQQQGRRVQAPRRPACRGVLGSWLLLLLLLPGSTNGGGVDLRHTLSGHWSLLPR